MTKRIEFETDPTRYQHWRISYAGAVATLLMDVDENGGLFEGYQLKLNSYDLGVDIELADIVQRMRFEHPEIGAVVLRSAKDRVFCAGANIRMLGGAAHAHKVNFCKFTNETRNALEAAGAQSGQYYICAIKGACAGGGYELALACDHIILTDDGSSSVALPEAPLLAVLPGTGGLTRITDKRKMRRDLADVFCTIEEGVRGKRAVEWRLVDEAPVNSKFEATIAARAAEFSAKSPRAAPLVGVTLAPLARSIGPDGSLRYSTVEVQLDRARGLAVITLAGPDAAPPASLAVLHAQGASAYMLRLARELDDAILHLRFNELELGVLVFKSRGDSATLLAHEKLLLDNMASDWLAREILLYWARVLKRIDLTSRSLVALIEAGSCFAGVLAEIPFACDRAYMQDGAFAGANVAAAISLSAANFGPMPMSNGLTRLQTRFLGEPEKVAKAAARQGVRLEAAEAIRCGLVTFAFDEVDWDDEVRIFLEERAKFSPDAMTGMEANLRFPGPETMETRIFGRLTAWQNWIFQRPNAVGESGALQRYGTGLRGEFDKRRV